MMYPFPKNNWSGPSFALYLPTYLPSFLPSILTIKQPDFQKPVAASHMKKDEFVPKTLWAINVDETLAVWSAKWVFKCNSSCSISKRRHLMLLSIDDDGSISNTIRPSTRYNKLLGRYLWLRNMVRHSSWFTTTMMSHLVGMHAWRWSFRRASAKLKLRRNTLVLHLGKVGI